MVLVVTLMVQQKEQLLYASYHLEPLGKLLEHFLDGDFS
jgi:hypothetical protein